MFPLIEKLCKLLECTPRSLPWVLDLNHNRALVFQYLKTFDLFLDRDEPLAINPTNDLTLLPAAHTHVSTCIGPAKTVRDMYAWNFQRHLEWPEMQCLFEYRGREIVYYPLEAVLVRPKKTPS